MAETLLLLTSDDPKVLKKNGSSGDWTAKASRAIGCDYVIICDLTTKAGVLAAIITGVMKADDNRVVIHFKDAVEINEPNVWGRKSSNPVGYVNTANCGVDFSDLGLKPI
ncbi:MAG: hypothetical protein GVY34_00945 [Alphaproteobacteria bacterium]|jgi:hypothetical protein|nr:hypothetical protein [Alphaproteobacteria bacterium]